MPAIYSQLFTAPAATNVFWTFPAAVTPRRVGIEIESQNTVEYDYKGWMATFVTASDGPIGIFPELAIGAVWSRRVAFIMPVPILMSSLLFRRSRQRNGTIRLRMFYDVSLN